MNCMKRQHSFSYDFELEGCIESPVLFRLTSEVLKHVLYQRQQIPLPFPHLERQVSTSTAVQEAENETTEKPNIKRLSDKKAVHFIDSMNKLLLHLEKAFDSVGTSITQVLIILGATVVSPKEVFVLKFPCAYFDGEKLNAQACVRNFFRQLISQDMFGDMKQIAMCGLHLLLEAPRDCTMEWFQPKANYKLPVRGNHYVFHLQNTVSKSSMSEDLSMIDDMSFNISGISPLESSYNGDASLHEAVNNLHISSESDSGVCDEELIWYQAPLILKGFRDKNHKSSAPCK